jgi:predicted RNase H-like HicB family nuclease
MGQKPEDILKEPYSRILIPEEGGAFSAELLEFPGCFAQGNSIDEAFNNLEEAAKGWIEASLEQGLDIPTPALNQSYSGKIVLRMPRSLHKRVAQMAERDATSINQFLVTAIAARVGAEEYHSYLYNNFLQGLSYTILNQFNIQSTINNTIVIRDLVFTHQESTALNNLSSFLVAAKAGDSLTTKSLEAI